MLYHITLCWKFDRYYREFPLHSPRPETQFRRIREQYLQSGGTLPFISDWSFGVECNDVNEYQISARCLSPLHKDEIERLFVRALVPRWADRIEVSAKPHDFMTLSEHN